MTGVVLSDRFIESVYELPKEIATKVWKAIRMLFRNPQSGGLHLERLRGNLYSARVDQKYRILLLRNNLKPPVLLFVGGHDDAYRFAERMPAWAVAEEPAFSLQPSRQVERLTSVPSTIAGEHWIEIVVNGRSLGRIRVTGNTVEDVVEEQARIAGIRTFTVRVDGRDLTQRSSTPLSDIRRIEIWAIDRRAAPPYIQALVGTPLETLNSLLRGRKYFPITRFLLLQQEENESIDLSFRELEYLISGELPTSAFAHRAWWANDRSHVQAAAWLAVGWKIAGVDLANKRVQFQRAASGTNEIFVSAAGV